jgi:alpha-L-rhamnosidase
MGWLNDLGARSEELVYNFEAARFLENFACDITDAQNPATGAIADTAPFEGGREPADPVSVSYLLIPALLHQHYGDRRVLTDNYEGMRRWVDYLTSRSANGLLPYSYYGDWAPPIGEAVAGSIGSGAVSAKTPGELVSTAFYFYSAKLLSEIAAETGRPADHAVYSGLAERIRTAFHRAYWKDQIGGYGSGNQACNCLALYMGLVPPGLRPRVVASLLRDLERTHFHLTTGNLCTKYLLEVLAAEGHLDAAVRIATQTSYPSWGYMLDHGATTLWERWEWQTGGGMNSHNHAMLGSVGSWLYRWVAGLALDESQEASRHFIFQPPALAALSQAHASLPTPWGVAEIQWQREGQSLDGVVRVPWNCTATLRLPGQPPRELASGVHKFGAGLKSGSALP